MNELRHGIMIRDHWKLLKLLNPGLEADLFPRMEVTKMCETRNKEGYSESRANGACYALWDNKHLAWSGKREAGGYDFSVTPEGSDAAKNGTL
jgi:hypothetical protein